MMTVSKTTEYRDLIADDYDLSQDSLLNYSEFASDTLLEIAPTITEFTSVASSSIETSGESLEQIILNDFVDWVKEKEPPFIVPEIESNDLASAENTEKIASAIGSTRTFDLGQSFGWIGNDLPISKLSTQPQRCGCSACCGSNDFNNDSQSFQKTANHNSLAPQANTGAYFIDALLPTPANYWSSSTVSYSFTTSVPSYYPWNNSERNNFIPFNTTQVNAARRGLQLFSEISGLRFVEVSDAGAGGTIRFGTANLGNGKSAHAYLPDNNPWGGDVWLNNSYSPNYTQTNGSYGFLTMVHEIGHALGLKHPGNYNAGGGGTPGPYLPTQEDSTKYTVMSYNNHPGSGVHAQTPMLYDIAAIQYLYGANTNTRTGNNTYTWNTNQAFVQTIWDAGGNDTISAANQFLGATINLNPGSFSSIGSSFNNSSIRANSNLAIAYGVTIENAIGGAGNDTLIGNSVANNLSGGGGHDTLIGGAGNDRLTGYGGGTEFDVLTGGTGTDTFVLGNSNVFYQGDGYARITDFDWRYDYIQVKGTSHQYSLQSGNWFGSNALDTAIFFGNDAIGVVQDSTNVSFARDFIFV